MIRLDLTRGSIPSAEQIEAVKAAFATEQREGERRGADVGHSPERRSPTSRRSDDLDLGSMSRASLEAALR